MGEIARGWVLGSLGSCWTGLEQETLDREKGQSEEEAMTGWGSGGREKDAGWGFPGSFVELGWAVMSPLHPGP